MRSLSLFYFCLVMLFAQMTGQASAAEKMKIIVGGDHANPPYEFLDNGTPTGFNVELMRAVADAVGADVEFRLGPWSQVRRGLEQEKIDALAGMYYSEERSRTIDFSVPHTMVTAGLFVRKNSPIRSVDDMKGKEVIVQKGDVIDDYLRREGIASRLIQVEDPADVLRLLASGRHDCAIMPSRLQGEYLLKTLGISNVRALSADLPQLRYCFAVKKGNTPLKYRLDEGLNILKVNGRYQEIYDKWFGVYEKGRLWRTVRYFVWALAVIAGLLAASSLWSWALRREVAKRTAELRESEEKFRVLADTSPVAICLIQGERHVYVNQAMMNRSGYTEQEFMETSFWGFIHEEYRDLVRERGLARQRGEQVPSPYEIKWLTRSGEEKWALLSAGRIEYRGAPAIIATLFDITDRKRMEDELRATHDELEKQVLERTAELRRANELLEEEIVARNRTERVITARLRLLEFAATHSLDELLEAAINEAEALTGSSIGFYHFLEADQKTLSLQNWSTRTKEEFCSAEGSGLHSDPSATGVWIDCVRERKPVIHNNCASLPHRKGLPPGHADVIRELVLPVFRGDIIVAVIGVGNKPHDYTAEDLEAVAFLGDLSWEIAERKQAEQALVRSGRNLTEAQAIAHLGSWEYDLESGRVFWSDEFARILGLGCRPSSLSFESPMDFIHPEEKKHVRDKVDAAIRDGIPYDMEYRIVRPDGEERFVHARGMRTCDGKGRAIRFIGSTQDITERNKLEKELLLSHFIINKAGIGIHQVSLDDGRILQPNETLCESLGYSRDELRSMTIMEIDDNLNGESFEKAKNIVGKSGVRTFETVFRRKDGTTFPVEITANELEYEGKPAGFVFVKDIAERKKMEEALKESESRVRRKLESILDPEGDTGELELADIIDAPGIQALMDDLYRNTGIKMSIIDLKGKVLVDVGWQEICRKFHRGHPETRERCRVSDTVMTEGVPPGWFRRYHCKNNMWHLVTPIMVGGRQMGNLFMGQFFFENEKIDYALFRAQAREFGFPEEEYIAALEAVPRHSEECVNSAKAFFLRLVGMFSKLSYGNIKLARLLAERDRLTEKLRQANMVVENSPVVLFRWGGGDEWPVELVSANIVQFGYAPEEFLSGALTYSSIIHPGDLGRVTREVHDICNGGGDLLRLEYRITTRGGDIRWVNELTNVERDGNGRVKGYEGIVMDITDRKQAEEELRKANMVVENSPVVLFRCTADPGWPVELVSKNVVQFGYEPEEFLSGKITYSSIVYPQDLEKVAAETEELSAAGKEQWFQEYRIVTREGDIRWIIDETVCERNEAGDISHYEGVIIDVTERRKAEEQLILQQMQLKELNRTLEERVREEVTKNREKDIMLIQQNRQAALGEILDHIAHQWKQPLNTISLITYLLKEDESLTKAEVGGTADKILDQVEHMTQTLKVFRDFYRPDKEKSVFLVEESIARAISFIETALRVESVRIDFEAETKLAAEGYPKEFAQVILNLLSNAREAFREKAVDRPELIIRAFAEGDMAVVTVTDNGGGICEANLGSIFDLNFTTKLESGGTGIGLYMSKNIIERHMGGTLTAANVGGGAQFTIRLKGAAPRVIAEG